MESPGLCNSRRWNHDVWSHREEGPGHCSISKNILSFQVWHLWHLGWIMFIEKRFSFEIINDKTRGSKIVLHDRHPAAKTLSSSCRQIDIFYRSRDHTAPPHNSASVSDAVDQILRDSSTEKHLLVAVNSSRIVHMNLHKSLLRSMLLITWRLWSPGRCKEQGGIIWIDSRDCVWSMLVMLVIERKRRFHLIACVT